MGKSGSHGSDDLFNAEISAKLTELKESRPGDYRLVAEILGELRMRDLARKLVPSLSDMRIRTQIYPHLCRYTNLQPSEAKKLTSWQLIPFIELAIELKTGKAPDLQSEEESVANTQKLFPKGIPKNPDIVDLAVRLNAARDGTGTKKAIACELTREPLKNCPKAKSLLSQLRRLSREGRLSL